MVEEWWFFVAWVLCCPIAIRETHGLSYFVEEATGAAVDVDLFLNIVQI